jgi:alpha-beta hydrolase superfamily lysophospholipase
MIARRADVAYSGAMEHFISPLTIDGLRGRIMHLPGPSKPSKEVLFVYGHHSSLERWQGIMQFLNQRCAVTMADLPGFGGMESLYKIGKPATLDNLADYLADFIRMRYKNGERLTIIGMSLGFVIVTRMLQRHAELTKQVEMLVSLFGFAHKNDFILPPNRRNFFLWGSRVFAMPVLADMYRTLFLNRFVLSRAYHRTPNAREKFKDTTPEQQRNNMEFEIGLWQNSDLRTYMKTGSEFLTLDNTRVKINLPVYHIAVAADRYFDNKSVEKHFRQIFSEYHLLAELKNANHAPTFIANAEQAALFIPPALLDAIAHATND